MGPNHPLTWRQDLDRWEVHYSLTHPESNWREVWEWCLRTFGSPAIDKNTGKRTNWAYHGGWIYFYDEKYVMMYTLRWS